MRRFMTCLAQTLLALALVLSCQKDDLSGSDYAPGTAFTVTAAAGSPDWAVGDSLGVIDNTGSHLFLATQSGRTALFKGKSYASAQKRIFMHPYRKGINFDPNVLTFTVPEEQSSASPISYGVSGENSVSLTQASSEISLTISSGDVEYVRISGLSGETLSGQASVNLADGSISTEEKETSLKLVPPAGEKYLAKGEHRLTCLPVEASGFSVEVMHEGGLSSDKSISGGSLNLGTVDDDTPWDHRTVEIDLVFITNPGEASLVWPFETPDISVIPSTTASYAFPSKETKFTMPASKGGYTFRIFATTGVIKNSKRGLCMYGNVGDYMTLPVVEGLMLTKVTLLAGSDETSVKITDSSGVPVFGGSASSIGGGSFTWDLYGAKAGTEYRLEFASTRVFIQQLHLEYAGIAPQAPVDPLKMSEQGLDKAASGEERYNIIARAHTQAVAQEREIDYSGVGVVDLVIPSGAKAIPLGKNTDFKGTTFRVLNNSKDLYLFSMKGSRKAVVVTGKQIDAADYSAIPQLATGTHLLAIEDGLAWVENRQGYDYGATRREVVLVKDGVGSNGPVAPYDTPSSSPLAWYCETDETLKTFSNITLERDAACTYKTYLVSFEMQNNIKLSNITINTPKSELYGDSSISFKYCTNVVLEDGIFEGNYSLSNKWGYSIACNGTWNTVFRRLRSNCPWAVFGNNNTHKSIVENCNIERYDTHCYGRDITLTDCILNRRGLPVSSVFGTVLLERCTFKDCYLYAMRPDYNAYVDFNLIIKDCIQQHSGSSIITHMGRLDNEINSRPELAKKRWPNVEIDGLTVNLPSWATQVLLFYVPSNTYEESLGYMSKISIKGLTFKYASSTASTAAFKLCNVPVKVENDFQFSFSGSSLNSPSDPSAKAKVYLNIHGPNTSVNVTDPNVELVNEE